MCNSWILKIFSLPSISFKKIVSVKHYKQFNIKDDFISSLKTVVFGNLILYNYFKFQPLMHFLYLYAMCHSFINLTQWLNNPKDIYYHLFLKQTILYCMIVLYKLTKWIEKMKRSENEDKGGKRLTVRS